METFVQFHVHGVPVAQAVVGIIGNQGKALSCIEKRGAEAVRPIPQIDDGRARMHGRIGNVVLVFRIVGHGVVAVYLARIVGIGRERELAPLLVVAA